MKGQEVSLRNIKVKTWRADDLEIKFSEDDLNDFEGQTTLSICKAVEAIVGIPSSYMFLKCRQSVTILNGASGDLHKTIDQDLIKLLLDNRVLDIMPNRKSGVSRRRNPIPQVKKLRQSFERRSSGEDFVTILWELDNAATDSTRWMVDFTKSGEVGEWSAGVEENTMYDIRVRARGADVSNAKTIVVHTEERRGGDREEKEEEANDDAITVISNSSPHQKKKRIRAEKEVKSQKKVCTSRDSHQSIGTPAAAGQAQDAPIDLTSPPLPGDVNVFDDCLFCASRRADVLFSCGHLSTCKGCFTACIKLQQSKCPTCSASVDSFIQLSNLQNGSRTCALSLNGCTGFREVAYSCGCFKHCKNCADCMAICPEHRVKLSPENKIIVLLQGM